MLTGLACHGLRWEWSGAFPNNGAADNIHLAGFTPLGGFGCMLKFSFRAPISFGAMTGLSPLFS